MLDTGLKNKIVLITGANHGIGAETAKAFAKEGAKVFINYLRISPEEYDLSEDEVKKATVPGLPLYHAKRTMSADAVVDEIKKNGGQAKAWEADLTDPNAIPKLFDLAEKAFGSVEILVNNAVYWKSDTFLPKSIIDKKGLSKPGSPTITITHESHDQHFAVNSRAVALMMAEFAQRHIKRSASWGRIINISTDGASAFPGEISYGASKHAIESYSRSAAGELGPYGITVNIVSPGPVQTGYISKDFEKSLVLSIPLRRIGQPEDIANAIVFFASQQADWITGQLLYVGGGHVMPL